MITKVKLKLSIFLLVILNLINQGCSKSDSPRAVAEKFFNEMSVQNFDAAKQYGTAETENLLNMMNGFKKISADTTLKEVKYEILRESLTGDNAIIFYLEDGKKGELQLPMTREKGKWMVNMNKESINNSDPSMDLGATNLDTTKGK